MAIPKLPPPPRNPQTFEEVNDYLRRIHVFLRRVEDGRIGFGER
jgi:hypothetical protein